jgi:acetylornithine deacetylase/succinyl-diaminopimelate desuccinylase-like protein
MLRPLINVRGLRAGDVGEAARNVVPASAVASLDLRLVPGQDPEAAIRSVREHVAGLGFHLVDDEPDAATRRRHRRIARVTGTPGYPGVRTPIGHPAAARVIEAVRAAGGDPILLPSFGGSVPLHHFVEMLGSPPVILPIANADNHQHAADENLRVGNLWYGIDVLAALLG